MIALHFESLFSHGSASIVLSLPQRNDFPPLVHLLLPDLFGCTGSESVY